MAAGGPPGIGWEKTLPVAALLSLFTSSQGLLLEASKVDGRYPYDTAVVPLLAEGLKLLLSMALLLVQRAIDPKGTRVSWEWRSSLLYSVPSLIYVVHNNVQFLTMKYMEPTVYQVLSNLKIVTTGFLSWACLRRHLSRSQWSALFLLMCGATTSQLQGCTPGCSQTAVMAVPIQGLFLSFLSAILSATAGVYTEWVMKRGEAGLWCHSCQLYAWGTLLNAALLTARDMQAGQTDGFWVSTLTSGFNGITWAVVANFSIAGLFVGWIVRYADAIVKVYATSSAMFVTAVLSAWLFGPVPSLQLLLGIAITAISVHLYFTPTDLQPPTSPSRKGADTGPALSSGNARTGSLTRRVRTGSESALKDLGTETGTRWRVRPRP